MYFESWAIAHCAGKKLANDLGASRPERYALTCNDCIEAFDANKTLQISKHLFTIAFFVLFSDHKFAQSQAWILCNQFGVFGYRNLRPAITNLLRYRQAIIFAEFAVLKMICSIVCICIFVLFCKKLICTIAGLGAVQLI